MSPVMMKRAVSETEPPGVFDSAAADGTRGQFRVAGRVP